MLAYLRGNIIFLSANSIIVDVNGVGYEVVCLGSDISSHNNNDHIELYIYTQIKEDSITLFGFKKMREKEWFANLLNIQGVGGKVAMAILQNLNIDDIAHAVSNKDHTILQRVPGIGGKLAQRLVNEFNLKNVSYINVNTKQAVNKNDVICQKNNSLLEDAEEALVGLGFAKAEVRHSLADFYGKDGETACLEELIRHGLNRLSKFK